MEQLDKEPVAKNAPRPKRSQSKKPVAQPKGGEPHAVAQAQEVAAIKLGDEVKTNSEELTKVAEQQDESVQGAEQNATETETVQAAPATATEPSYKDSLVIKVKSTSPQRHYEVASRTWIEPHAVTLIQCKSALQKRTTLSNLKQMGGRNNKFEVIHDSV
ncbi:MAG TPA: hypothetical protein PLQ39_13105 [Acinetobacter sp.]|nr:hypothetical protein [Acinetobacter sp.]